MHILGFTLIDATFLPILKVTPTHKIATTFCWIACFNVSRFYTKFSNIYVNGVQDIAFLKIVLKERDHAHLTNPSTFCFISVKFVIF